MRRPPVFHQGVRRHLARVHRFAPRRGRRFLPVHSGGKFVTAESPHVWNRSGPGRAAVRAQPSEAGRFGRYCGFAALGPLVGQVFPLVVSIFVARRLGVSAYGIFVFGFAFPSWFLLVVSLGLDEAISKNVAADRSRASRYLTTVLLLRLLLGAIALVAMWVGIQFVLTDPLARTVTMLLGTASVIAAYANTFTSIFRAFERFEYAALVTVVERSVTVGISLVLLLLGRGLLEVCVAFLIGSLTTLALSGAIATRKFAFFARTVNAQTLEEVVKTAIPFGLANSVATFVYTTGLVLLTILRDSASTGLFNAAFTLLFGLFSFLSILSSTLLPMMSRLSQESRGRLATALQRIQKLALIGGGTLPLGGGVFAGAIITKFSCPPLLFAGDSFRRLLFCFFVATAMLGDATALPAVGRMKLVLYIGCVASVSTITLSLLLIPPFGAVGAAYAFFASHLLAAGLGALAVRRLIAPLGTSRMMVKSVFAGFVMLFVLVAIPPLPLLLGVATGAGVYFAVLFAIRGASKEDRALVGEALRGAFTR